MGLAAAKQPVLPRVARTFFDPCFFMHEAGSGLVASRSCTHFYITTELTVSAYLSWYNNTVTTLGASMSSYLAFQTEIFSPDIASSSGNEYRCHKFWGPHEIGDPGSPIYR